METTKATFTSSKGCEVVRLIQQQTRVQHGPIWRNKKTYAIAPKPNQRNNRLPTHPRPTRPSQNECDIRATTTRTRIRTMREQSRRKGKTKQKKNKKKGGGATRKKSLAQERMQSRRERLQKKQKKEQRKNKDKTKHLDGHEQPPTVYNRWQQNNLHTSKHKHIDHPILHVIFHPDVTAAVAFADAAVVVIGCGCVLKSER